MHVKVAFSRAARYDSSTLNLFIPYPTPLKVAYPDRVLSHRGALANVTDAGQDAVDAAASGAKGSDGAGPAGPVSCKPDADVRRWRGRLRRVVPVSRVAPSPEESAQIRAKNILIGYDGNEKASRLPGSNEIDR